MGYSTDSNFERLKIVDFFYCFMGNKNGMYSIFCIVVISLEGLTFLMCILSSERLGDIFTPK